MEIVITIISLLLGVAGVGYAIYTKRIADEAAQGAIMGAPDGPSVMVVLSQKGYHVMLKSESRFPHFDVWVRIHDYAADKIFDPTVLGPASINDPTVMLPDLYPNHANLNPFYEIDLSQKPRVRVNIFIQTRNSKTHLEIVAIRDGEKNKIAYKEWNGQGDAKYRIPDDFPVVQPEDPNSLFREDEPTGRVYYKGPDGNLVEAPNRPSAEV